MSRPGIKTSLLGAFGATGLLFGMFAAGTVTNLSGTNSQAVRLSSVWLQGVSHAGRMDSALADLKVGYRDHIFATDTAERADADKRIAKETEQFHVELGIFDRLSMEDAIEAGTSRVRDLSETYFDTSREVVRLFAAGSKEAVYAYLSGKLRPVGNELSKAKGELSRESMEGADRSAASSKDISSRTVTITVAAVGLILFVIGAAALFAVYSSARPLETLTRSMRRMLDGETSIDIPYAGRSDETGAVANAMEAFRHQADEKLRVEAEAARDRQEAERERERAARVEAQSLASTEKATAGLAFGLRQLAAGNLSIRIGETFSAEHEPLRADFNASLASLSQAMMTVADPAASIEAGTIEISTSSDDLSRRTEQQAAALEQTASALDQITTNMANWSRRSEEARSVAEQANASTAQSRAVVAGAVEAMQRIEESSGQISSVIRVIDEIAFQTNLLALNAGGAGGRGGERVRRRRVEGPGTGPAFGEGREGKHGPYRKVDRRGGQRRTVRERDGPGTDSHRTARGIDKPSHGGYREVRTGVVDRATGGQRRHKADGSGDPAERGDGRGDERRDRDAGGRQRAPS